MATGKLSRAARTRKMLNCSNAALKAMALETAFVTLFGRPPSETAVLRIRGYAARAAHHAFLLHPELRGEVMDAAHKVLLAADVALVSYRTTAYNPHTYRQGSYTAELKAIVNSMNEFCTVTLEGPAVMEFLRKVKPPTGDGERRILRLSIETTDRVTP